MKYKPHKLIDLLVFNSQQEIKYISDGFNKASGLNQLSSTPPENIKQVLSAIGLSDKSISLDELDYCSFILGNDKRMLFRSISSGDYLAEILEETKFEGDDVTFNIDELTGIPTRNFFKHKISELLNKIDTTEDELVVVAADLDYFKKVNDTLGHAAGDDLLQKVVLRIKNVVRETDVFVRMGGDEFALIMIQNKNSNDVEMFANRLIERISRPFLIYGQQVNIGISLGLVSSSVGETDPDEFHKMADIALYTSKKSGRGRFTWFEERMAVEIESRQKLEIELRRALVLGQLKLQFEPQIYQLSGEVHTLQSVIVWNHPEHGALDEKMFMGIADSVGLISDVSRWQFEKSFAEAKRLGAEFEISLRVHSRFFSEKGFVDYISKLAEKYELDLQCICLEFSESVLLENEKISGELMLQLSRLGVRLSLGDFGSGLVALSYLRVLPFSQIKIDFSSFMQSKDEGSKSTMATKIAELGNSLGIRVLASVDDNKIIHKVLSKGQFSHIERLKVAAPIDVEKINDFLNHIEKRKGNII